MLTIKCPNCKRGLTAPEGIGDHQVVCPSCKVAFAVLIENGAARTLSTSVLPELPVEEPPSIVDEMKPPVLLPPINSSVYEDEGAKRTRRIHTVFKVVFLGTLAFSVYKFLSEAKGPPDWVTFFAFSPAVLFLAFVLAGGSALVVGNVIGYQPDSNQRGQEALARMKKALWEEAPAAIDDGTTCPPDPSAPSSTDVRPNKPSS